jgi:hypothetical protein
MEEVLEREELWPLELDILAATEVLVIQPLL